MPLSGKAPGKKQLLSVAQRTLRWKDHPVKTGRKGEDFGVGGVHTVRMEKGSRVLRMRRGRRQRRI